MFDSARLKIERANHHIANLEAEFAAYVATKPHRFSVHNDPNTGQPQIRIRFVSDPTQHLSLIVGDAVHNIRAALDYMTWEAVGLDGGTQDRHLILPTGDSRVNYEASCKGIKTPSEWVKDLFISLEVFPGGKSDGLYTLNQLDITDKHTILPLVVKATVAPDFTIFNPVGIPAVSMSRNTFVSSSTDFINIANIPPGYSVELDDNAECAPAIVFKDFERPFQPVIPTLKQFAQLALGTIQVFETSFSQ